MKIFVEEKYSMTTFVGLRCIGDFYARSRESEPRPYSGDLPNNYGAYLTRYSLLHLQQAQRGVGGEPLEGLGVDGVQGTRSLAVSEMPRRYMPTGN